MARSSRARRRPESSSKAGIGKRKVLAPETSQRASAHKAGERVELVPRQAMFAPFEQTSASTHYARRDIDPSLEDGAEWLRDE